MNKDEQNMPKSANVVASLPKSHILSHVHCIILVHILEKRSYSLIFRPRLTNNGKDPITQKEKVL